MKVEIHLRNIYTNDVASSSISDRIAFFTNVFFTGIVTATFYTSKPDDQTVYCIPHNGVFSQYSFSTIHNMFAKSNPNCLRDVAASISYQVFESFNDIPITRYIVRTQISL